MTIEVAATRLPRVMIVDDEKLLADTTAAILRHAGFDAAIAYDGFEALAAMESLEPDYLLADIMMPAMNGVELAMRVAQKCPATRILLISGQTGISDLLENSRARGYEFPWLAKPVPPGQLIERLRDLKEG